LGIESGKTLPLGALFWAFPALRLGIIWFGFQRPETVVWEASSLETGAVLDGAMSSHHRTDFGAGQWWRHGKNV